MLTHPHSLLNQEGTPLYRNILIYHFLIVTLHFFFWNLRPLDSGMTINEAIDNVLKSCVRFNLLNVSPTERAVLKTCNTRSGFNYRNLKKKKKITQIITHVNKTGKILTEKYALITLAYLQNTWVQGTHLLLSKRSAWQIMQLRGPSLNVSESYPNGHFGEMVAGLWES